MRKRTIFVGLIAIAGTLGGILMVQRLTERKEVVSHRLKGTRIVLYEKVKQKVLDNQSLLFPKILDECERLLKTADDGLKLSVTKELIERIKKEQLALEVIYPGSANIPVWGTTYSITELLIPLTGEFSDGVIFFGTIIKDEPYYGNAINRKGITKLKKLLKNMGGDSR